MKNASEIRIFVVDDHQMFTDGLIELLGGESDLTIVGHASTAASAKQRVCAPPHPDVVLMDVHLPDGSGFSVHEWINENCLERDHKILYVTGDDDLSSINRAMNLGAIAYLDKTGGWEEVANAIRRARSGLKTLGLNITQKLAVNSVKPGVEPLPLSFRETEILIRISKGLTAKEMSAEMNLAMPTVRTYVSRLFKKLGARDRAHAVALGYARGLIDPGQ